MFDELPSWSAGGEGEMPGSDGSTKRWIRIAGSAGTNEVESRRTQEQAERKIIWTEKEKSKINKLDCRRVWKVRIFRWIFQNILVVAKSGGKMNASTNVAAPHQN